MTQFSEHYWRRAAAPRVAKVIESMEGSTQSAIRLALKQAYPFGNVRDALKAWDREVERQLGIEKRAGTVAEAGELFE